MINYIIVILLSLPPIGEPFKLHYWLAQCMVVLFVMLIMKLMIGPLILLKFWSKVRVIGVELQDDVMILLGRGYYTAGT